MTQWVALLYSITISPTRRVQRSDLTGLAEGLGFSHAKTVLSTGNLIFAAEGEETSLAAAIENRIVENWGRAIPVLLRSVADFRAMRADNPFPDCNPALVSVRVMRDAPSAEDLARLHALSGPEAVFAVRERALWVATPEPLVTSPLIRAMGSQRLGTGTFRNASALGKIAAALD